MHICSIPEHSDVINSNLYFPPYGMDFTTPWVPCEKHEQAAEMFIHVLLLGIN